MACTWAGEGDPEPEPERYEDGPLGLAALLHRIFTRKDDDR